MEDFADLKDFYLLDENGDPVLNDAGENVYQARPETKSLNSLTRVIELNKPLTVVNKFVELHVTEAHWDWFESYNKHLFDLSAAKAFNANLPVIAVDEAGANVFAEPVVLPVAPERPEKITTVQFKARNKDLFNQHAKTLGADINGYIISLNESNQNGIAAVLTGLKLAAEVDANIFPMQFNAETATGVILIPFTDLAAFKTFALTFMTERQAFFN